MPDLRGLPGGEWVEEGLRDLAAGRKSVSALLVAICPTRLRRLGLAIPPIPWPEPELQLYRLLCAQEGNDAYSRYNSLRRRLDSFARALEREHSAALRRAAPR